MEWPEMIQKIYLTFSRIFDGLINFFANIADYFE